MSFEIVVIGTGGAGLKRLQAFLWDVPADFPLPVVIVQHRSRDSELGLCEFLKQHCRLPLSEPEDKEPIQRSHVYIAPRDYHLLLERDAFVLSTDHPICFARPSIDVLFESAADAYDRSAIGLLLSRRTRDGLKGLEKIRARGGLTLIANDELLDRPVIVSADHVMKLSSIPGFLVNLLRPQSVSYGT